MFVKKINILSFALASDARDSHTPVSDQGECPPPLPGRSVFDSPVSARPGGSEAVGGREKTKTENRGGPGGPQLREWGWVGVGPGGL